MSPPIYTPDGSEVNEIVLPDGSTASEVIGPDGNVVFEAAPDIPDSGVSRYEYEQDVTDSWSDNDGVDNTSAGFSTDSQTGSYAKELDGTDDWVDAKNVADDLSGAFSVSVWVNTDTVSGSQFIVNFADSGSVDPSLILFDDQPSWTMNDGGGGNASSSETITTGTYYHIVGTYDGNNNSTIYVDGSQTGTNSGDDPSLSGDVSVGSNGNGNRGFYDGLLDELRFYNKELSGTEVSNLYNTGSIDG